jgi:hypothetical protein
MKKLAAKLLFKILFGLGEAACWLAFTKFFGRYEWPYSVYNWFMHQSLKVNDKYQLGQWQHVDTETSGLQSH